MLKKLKSRKFWIAVVSAILLILCRGLGRPLPEDAILAVAGVVISYILGQSHVDAAEHHASGGGGGLDENYIAKKIEEVARKLNTGG